MSEMQQLGAGPAFAETEWHEFGEFEGGEFEFEQLEGFEAGFEFEGEQHEQFLGSLLGSVLGGEMMPLNEALEAQLASELLEVTSEQELEQFLGNLFKRVARGVSGFIKSPVGRALGGVLKGVAKTALPMVGGALGSMAMPGVGTALGSKLGSMASKLFEVELESMPNEQAEYEVARRFVNLAAHSARHAAAARPRPGINPRTIARAAVARAARRFAPGIYRSMVRSLRTGLARPGTMRPGAMRPFRPGFRPGSVYGGPTFAYPSGYSPDTTPAAQEPLFDDGAMTPQPSFQPSQQQEPVPDAGEPAFGTAQDAPVSGRWIRRGRKIIVIGV